ncbi:MAG TPA: hypothetical protein VG603_11840 [Chitinophagales bacterium]|nr:hypothetical protein [Chitinophagales bacterium]
MSKSKFFAFAFLGGFVALVFIAGCKKSTQSEPLEPISLIEPDTPILRKFPGDSMPYQIKFTTDRPINWVLGMVDVDTLIDSSNYTPTYPDTLFFQDLTTLDPLQNIYTYSGSYYINDTLRPFSTIRFRVSFQAGRTSGYVGMNYPVGLKSATKDFTVNVR